ncbi:MAG: FliM/FliN family flagellar motor switch protein [Rhizobiaceae bacterium]|nr:FliM/FliN family flagellar motor switch protein [Rhizobiaceae bacterium]
MASIGTPAETRDYILERLVGETGEPEQVISATRATAEKAVARILQGLSDALGVSLEVDIKSVDLARLVDGRPDAASHSAVVLGAAATSPDIVLLSMDASAIALIVALAFGGDAEAPVDALDRDPSPIELELARTVLTVVAEAIGDKDEQSFAVKLPLAAPMSGPDIRRMTVRDTPAVRVVFTVSTSASRGEISLVVPQRAMSKHGGDAMVAGTSAERDLWGARFGGEVMRASVEVIATIAGPQMTLGALSKLNVGSVLALDAEARTNVHLSARDKTLFTCEFGRHGQNYSVRLREPFKANNDFVDELLPANRK